MWIAQVAYAYRRNYYICIRIRHLSEYYKKRIYVDIVLTISMFLIPSINIHIYKYMDCCVVSTIHVWTICVFFDCLKLFPVGKTIWIIKKVIDG